MTNEVLVHVDARGVATVTLNRPEVNNAYNEEMLRGVLEAVAAAQESLNGPHPVRCVVLRGRGKHFQAGADLGWLNAVRQTGPEENLAASALTASAVRKLGELEIPVIALVQGACFGGGTGVIAACDVVIATESSIYSIAEAKWGLHASIILPQLSDAIGARHLRRYALTGERFNAAEAVRLGLVHEVVADEEALEARGEEIVSAVLSCGPNAVSTTKRLARGFSWSGASDAEFLMLIEEHAAARQSREAAEGLQAFAEKRQPSWATVLSVQTDTEEHND